MKVVYGQSGTGSEVAAHASSMLQTSTSVTPPIGNANNCEICTYGSINVRALSRTNSAGSLLSISISFC